MNFKQSRKFLILSTVMYLLSNMPVTGMESALLSKFSQLFISSNVGSFSFQPKEQKSFKDASTQSSDELTKFKLDYVPDDNLKGWLKVARERQKLLTEKDLKKIVDYYANENEYFASSYFRRDLRFIFRSFGIPNASIYNRDGKPAKYALCIYNAGTYENENIKIGVIKEKKDFFNFQKIGFRIIPYEDFIKEHEELQSARIHVYEPSFISFNEKRPSPVLWLLKVMILRQETDPNKGCFKALKRYLEMKKLCFSCYSIGAPYGTKDVSCRLYYPNLELSTEDQIQNYLKEGIRVIERYKDVEWEDLHGMYDLDTSIEKIQQTWPLKEQTEYSIAKMGD